DDVHGACARRQNLFPRRHFRVRLDATHHADHQRRLHELALFDFDLFLWSRWILARVDTGDDVAGADASVAFEHDEPPRRDLAVIGNARADGENGLDLFRRGSWLA